MLGRSKKLNFLNESLKTCLCCLKTMNFPDYRITLDGYTISRGEITYICIISLNSGTTENM